VRAWLSEIYVAEDHLLGWRTLLKGRHVVSFVCTGKDLRSSGFNLGIDTIILARVASPEDTVAPRVPVAVLELAKTLESPDVILRGLAAVALRDLPPSSVLPVLPSLVRALRDPEVAVRMRAADAIARQGTAALPFLDALIAAVETPGEHVHVQRSVATALGAIGPAAARALPALAQLEKIPRVQATASTAIRLINAR